MRVLLQINLIAPPLYVLTTQSLDRQLGLSTMKNCLDVIEKAITASSGNFKVKKEVRSIYLNLYLSELPVKSCRNGRIYFSCCFVCWWNAADAANTHHIDRKFYILGYNYLLCRLLRLWRRCQANVRCVNMPA